MMVMEKLFYIDGNCMNLKIQKSIKMTYNGHRYISGFLFNIYTKIKNEDENFKTRKNFQRTSRKLEYI